MKGGKAFGYGVLAAIFAAIFATLFFSAVWQQSRDPRLLLNIGVTAEIFVKYAVAFFFLGMAKWKMHKIKELYTKKR